MFDICCLGDALIDFKPVKSVEGADCIQANAGGTAANVACACAHFGLRSAMIGKVGSDAFGSFLQKTFAEYGVNTDGLIIDDDVRTTLVFVTLDENGDRSFSFFRNPGADMMLREEEVNRTIVEQAKVFYFSTMALTDEPARSACLLALKIAKEKKRLICYDVNLREKLWKDLQEARRTIREFLSFADILKLSEEELRFVCDRGQDASIEDMSEELTEWCSPKLLVVSLGAKGCFFKWGTHAGMRRGYHVSTVVDTTGAGDAFVGGLLSVLCRKYEADISQCTECDLMEMLDFANAAGAIAVTRLGSITALPDCEEVEMLRRKQRVIDI